MCINDQICTSCVSGYYLTIRSTCENICQNRVILIFGKQDVSCQQCPYDCFNCDKNGLCVTCDSLNDHRVMEPQSKRCVPMIGYYDDNQPTCLRCPKRCESCISYTLCTSCISGYSLFIDNLCYSSCPQRYLFSGSSCVPCPYDCLSCDNRGNCLSCSYNIDHRILSSMRKRCLPLVGYYDNA